MSKELLTSFFLLTQKGIFLSFDLVILQVQVGDDILERHNFGLHGPLIVDNFTTFVLQVFSEVTEACIKENLS